MRKLRGGVAVGGKMQMREMNIRISDVHRMEEIQTRYMKRRRN
jgi:hypothetical protein